MVKEMLEPLPIEEEPKILKEVLGLDIEKVDHYTNLFAQWIATQKCLPQDFSNKCIRHFLIWSKLDLEKAKKKFLKFCYNTTTHSEFFCGRNISMEGDLKILDYSYLFSMPKLTPKAERVTIAKVFEPERYEAMEYCRYFALGIDYRMHKDNLVTGDIQIYDLEHIKPQYYGKMFNILYFKFLKLSMMDYPFMIRHIFVVNSNPIMEKGIAICKALVPEKIGNRLQILKDPQSLHKFIAPECLPADYGGTEMSLEELRKPYIEFMTSQEDFFLEVLKFKPTGPVPEEIRSDSDEYGVEGSFRKLNID